MPLHEILHATAMDLAKVLFAKEAALFDVLFRMKRAGCFEVLGFRGVFAYVHEALKLSETQSHYFQRVVEKALEVPELKEAVLCGKLSLSKARRIVPVITGENALYWMDCAIRLKQRELEELVARANPRSRVRERLAYVGPDVLEFTAAVSPDTATKLERVRDLESQRTRTAATWDDSLSRLTDLYLKKHDPVERARRASSRKSRPKPVAQPIARQGRTPIPSAIRHEVNLRDGYQCTATEPDGERCQQRRWLDRHHRVLVSEGGSNAANNIETLCAFHHRRHHHLENARRRRDLRTPAL